MLEANITEANMRLMQILSQVEQGEEAIIMREGQALARLSPIRQVRNSLKSRARLRSSQPLAASSSLKTLQNLRNEARY